MTPRPLASGRYAGALLALLVFLWGVAATLSWQPRRHNTCADKTAFFDPSSIPIANQYLGGKDFAGGLGFRRVDGLVLPTKAGEAALPFTFRRTTLMPEWLARPTRALPGPNEPDRLEERRIVVDGESVPVTFAYEMGRGLERFTAYIFAYDREAVRHPFWARFLDFRSLFRGTQPITYLGVSGAAHPQEIASAEERATQWLEAAWRHYRRTCTP